jgi:hypothetical protein
MSDLGERILEALFYFSLVLVIGAFIVLVLALVMTAS